MKRKPKKKTWYQLKDEQCPKCGSTLMIDLFGSGTVGCACGFVIAENVKTLLVNRDKE